MSINTLFKFLASIPTQRRNRRRSVRFHPEALEVRCLPAFSAPVVYPVGSSDYLYVDPSPHILVTADFNRDGHADLARVNNVERSLSVLLGNGDGTFKPKLDFPTGTFLGEFYVTYSVLASPGPSSVAAGDLNGDGNVDLVTTNAYGDDVSVLFGTGTGLFLAPLQVALPPEPSASDYHSHDVAIADLNSDGQADLVVSSAYSTYWGPVTQVHAYLGDGLGGFTFVHTFGGFGVYKPVIEIADLNADGHVDVIANGYSFDSFVAVYMGVGDGTFTDARRVETGASSYGVTVVDLNRDGKPDLATPAAVLLGNGDGTFQASRSYASGTRPFVVEAADFNRDGILDLLTGNAGAYPSGDGRSVTVELGKGDGTFRPPLDTGLTIDVVSLAIADFTGDGFPDVAASAPSDTVSVLINDRSWPPPQPALRISDVARKEGGQGLVAFTFTVSLSYASTETVTVNYATADGTAHAGQDYQAASGSLTFKPGETSKTITVWVYGDRGKEDDETFSLDLFGALHADLEDGQGIGTIWDDDRYNGR